MKHATARCKSAIFLLAIPTIAASQCGPAEREPPEAVSSELNLLFNKSLNAMEGTLPSGVKVTYLDSTGRIRA